MDDDILEALQELMEPELTGIQRQGSGLYVTQERRYGRLVLRFDFDPAAESLRMYTSVPPPPGAGPEFLVWCLSTNTLYWDVKIGLDAHGMLLIHSDVDLDQGDLTGTARVLLDRVKAMYELLDDDLVEYLLKSRLATPAQIERFTRSERR
jgi:hypothetical protein